MEAILQLPAGPGRPLVNPGLRPHMRPRHRARPSQSSRGPQLRTTGHRPVISHVSVSRHQRLHLSSLRSRRLARMLPDRAPPHAVRPAAPLHLSHRHSGTMKLRPPRPWRDSPFGASTRSKALPSSSRWQISIRRAGSMLSVPTSTNRRPDASICARDNAWIRRSSVTPQRRMPPLALAQAVTSSARSLRGEAGRAVAGELDPLELPATVLAQSQLLPDLLAPQSHAPAPRPGTLTPVRPPPPMPSTRPHSPRMASRRARTC